MLLKLHFTPFFPPPRAKEKFSLFSPRFGAEIFLFWRHFSPDRIPLLLFFPSLPDAKKGRKKIFLPFLFPLFNARFPDNFFELTPSKVPPFVSLFFRCLLP